MVEHADKKTLNIVIKYYIFLAGGDHRFKYQVRDFVPGRQNKFFENV